jgi:hypothetical protein
MRLSEKYSADFGGRILFGQPHRLEMPSTGTCPLLVKNYFTAPKPSLAEFLAIPV